MYLSYIKSQMILEKLENDYVDTRILQNPRSMEIEGIIEELAVRNRTYSRTYLFTRV